jgi:hypothetical protein
MTDANQTLETYQEGGSISARKMRTVADSIDEPKREGELLSPYRDNPAD